MTTDNKLLQSIIEAGEKQAEEIKAAASSEAEKIAEAATKEAEAAVKAINDETAAKAAEIKKAASGNASLVSRNAILQAKRAEIDKTIKGISDYILSLDDDSYFAFIYRFAEKLTEGEILFNERDKKRLPSDFSKKVKPAVSDENADISGGFILRSGKTEMNCSVEALIEEKRNELEDYINSSLFGKED